MADKKGKPAHVDLSVVPTKEVQSERIYANHLVVNHGPFDFTLTFCDTQPPLTKEEQDKVKSEMVLRTPVQVEIAIPIGLIEPIIEALKTNYEAYKKTYGKAKQDRD